MSECIVVLFFLLSLVLSGIDFSGESEVKAQVSKQQRVVFHIEKKAKSLVLFFGLFGFLFSFV